MSSPPPRTQIPNVAELPHAIATPRVKLVAPREADAEAFFPHVSNPDVATQMTWAPHKDLDETRAWLRRRVEAIAAGDDVTWTIEHDGGPVGVVGLHGIEWAMNAVRYDRAELGYWIAQPYWGKGLMTEAVTAVVRWAFDTLGLHKVNVQCFEDNTGSRRVIEKVGFRFVGRLEEDIWRDGKWHAHLRYELTVGEWADSTRTLRFQRPS